jgi:hypothetical protein
MQLLDQAEASYGSVLQLAVDPVDYGVPVQDLARLSLGNARLLRGVVLRGFSQNVQGSETLLQAEEMLKATLPAFQAPGLSRYLAQNHMFLGSTYQNSGDLASLSGDPSAAMQNYKLSIEQFDACIALGENSTDRILQSEIVAANCLPGRQKSEELLQVLSGGS